MITKIPIFDSHLNRFKFQYKVFIWDVTTTHPWDDIKIPVQICVSIALCVVFNENFVLRKNWSVKFKMWGKIEENIFEMYMCSQESPSYHIRWQDQERRNKYQKRRELTKSREYLDATHVILCVDTEKYVTQLLI